MAGYKQRSPCPYGMRLKSALFHNLLQLVSNTIIVKGFSLDYALIYEVHVDSDVDVIL